MCWTHTHTHTLALLNVLSHSGPCVFVPSPPRLRPVFMISLLLSCCCYSFTRPLSSFTLLSPPFPFFLSFFLCPHLKSSHGMVYCCSCFRGREGMKCFSMLSSYVIHSKNENCDYLLTTLLFQTGK